ncbi:DUF3300 domain-containing protein [Reyranella sp.]|uniref:DUF3300 domain-containing protein n=1 Tax=Reyranella sp. TaxID=1929291 RepID=UPI003BA8A960
MNRRIMMMAITAALILPRLRPAAAQDADKPFTDQQLDQMLAPIALYPDPLLAQTLMAASYPLEVVDAGRWLKANPGLKGDAAVAAAKDKSWDVSVKSLVAFPQVVAQMSEHLDWMQNIGDAMVAQQQDVADSIQRLRNRAADAGTLQSGKEQKVTSQGDGADRTIVIEPASPEIVYVPAYDSNTVYGTWPYPGAPPVSYPPPAGYGYGSALARGLLFGAGVAATSALFGGWNWGRGNSYVNVDVNRAVNIDRTFNAANVRNGTWQHDPGHRKGVAYRSTAARERYGQHAPNAAQRQEFRGRLHDAPARQGPAGGGQVRQQAAARANAPHPATRPNGPHPGDGSHPQIQNRVQNRPAGQHPDLKGRAAGVSHGGGAIRGVDHGQRVNREAARGRAQQARAQGHPRAGGHRGGRR